MMCVTFNGSINSTICSCYYPTNTSDEIDAIIFYQVQYSIMNTLRLFDTFYYTKFWSLVETWMLI